ncbi:FHA domain-containing protein [Chitinimonas arctica]|uniref:FHA domain-containing protein n=1 Tax=Chitinimonas arctica TaxID=2594795 RepID=A0A516SBB5_9NEIS|nr:FHA domain-containing protein [Chitinimonas arctica]QDQ25435.1 FHA domain-containing protein [Chitinimonas arctica]
MNSTPSTLRLTVLSHCEVVPIEALGALFDRSGGTLGRAPENRLVLADESQTVSRLQGRIEYREDAFYLNDLGNNRIEHNQRPLEFGIAARLHHGDRLRIGPYHLEVGLEGGAGVAGGVQTAAANGYQGLDTLASFLPLAEEIPLGSPTLRLIEADPLLTMPVATDGPAFAGSISDHVAPERLPLGGASHIFPDGYDPAAGLSRPGQPLPVGPLARSPALFETGPDTALTAAATQATEILARLLHGLGLPELALEQAEAPHFAERVGRLLRSAVEAALENPSPSRLGRSTSLQADAGVTLRQCLCEPADDSRPDGGVLVEALAAGNARQHDKIASLQAALCDVLLRLAPTRIQREAGAALPWQRSAKSWGEFDKQYQAVVLEYQRLCLLTAPQEV